MNPETINAIKEALVPVAEKIGQGGQYVWEVLVKGQFAEGVADLCIASVLSILIYIAAKKMIVLGKSDDADDWVPVYIFGVIFVIVGGPIALLCFYSGIIGTVAPEYAAIKFLITQTKY